MKRSFRWILSTPANDQLMFFQFGMEGDLKKASIIRGQKKDGEILQDQVLFEDLNKSDSLAQQELKHELDFWLKGMYRKDPKNTR